MNWKISNTGKYWEYSPMIASKKHITAKSKYPFLFCIHNRTIYTKWEVDVKSSRDNRNYCRTKSKKSLILIYSSQRDRICVFIRWSEILYYGVRFCIMYSLSVVYFWYRNKSDRNNINDILSKQQYMNLKQNSKNIDF